MQNSKMQKIENQSDRNTVADMIQPLLNKGHENRTAQEDAEMWRLASLIDDYDTNAINSHSAFFSKN